MNRLLKRLLLCLLLALSITACGSGDSSNSSADTSTIPDTTQTADTTDDLTAPKDLSTPADLQADLEDSDLLPVGAVCQQHSQCRQGLKCCYPCGRPGCQNKCAAVGNGECPAYP